MCTGINIQPPHSIPAAAINDHAVNLVEKSRII
jgi:hypothetical protein